jgi:tripartite-type tricarboxylate transporter receptor subunit TctC
MQFLFALVLVILGPVLGAMPALAQETFPIKPLRMVVPLPAGGPTDFMARTMAQQLAATLGQPVIVDNKPGADGAVAARDVMSAPPDGYTLLFAIGSMLAVPLQSKPAAFVWATEFEPVGKVGRVSFCLAVNTDVPAKSVTELIAYARANPGKLNYATSTLGELMAASQFMKATGIRMTRIPYKGGAQAMPDLLAGRIQVMFGPVTLVMPHAKSNAVRILATVLPRRSALLPDVPTMSEAGYAEVSVPTWQAIFVSAKTPRSVVTRLSADLAAAMEKSEVQAAFERRALFPEYATAQELAATVAMDKTAWANLIAEYKLTAE